MIEWTEKAIFDAIDVYSDTSDMSAALNAAVKAQGVKLDYATGRAHGRAEAFEEAAAYVEGKGGVIPGACVFARLVSRNNQPCMSGDPRDRLHRLDRRAFDDAMAWLAAAIRALAKETE